MEEIISSQSSESLVQAESTPPATAPETSQPDLQARRAERQRELLEAALALPDPKAAVIGSSVAEVLEFLPGLKTAILEATKAILDPVERLATARGGVQAYATILRFAEKLP